MAKRQIDIEIEYGYIRDAVVRHFSFIGKRLTDKNGTSLFGKVTMSSEEESLLKQYIAAATQIFVSELSPLLVFYDNENIADPSGTASFGVATTRSNDNSFMLAFQDNYIGFLISYIANAVLGMNYPELSKKYETDMKNHLQAAIRMIYYKEPPTEASSTMTDCEGSVSLETTSTKPMH